jgi:hypothetical protein
MVGLPGRSSHAEVAAPTRGLKGATMDQALATTNNSGAISAFASEEKFEAAQRMALALASSSLVPKEFQGKQNISNVLIAMELASRIGASVFAVIQHLDIIHGRPSWRATFLIATVNACGRFTPIRFRWQGQEGTDSWGCRAIAKDRESGEECVGPAITLKMAKDEGWSTKNGSKWRTMPDQMLCYRAAAFWTRLYAPELSLGMQTSDEAADVHGSTLIGTKGAAALDAELVDEVPSPVVVDSDGVVHDAEAAA